MISEEDKVRYLECKDCNTCKEWHKHCNAECCKTILIQVDPKELSKGSIYFPVKPSRKLGISDIWYYKYHDVNYVRGILRFKKDRIYVIGKKVYYLYPCEQLENNLCKFHGTTFKPIISQQLTLENAGIPGNPFVVTDNCLFKYKSKEVKKEVIKDE